MKRLLLILCLFGSLASLAQTTIKVSDLPNVTTPLNGDEYLLMVQNNFTRKGTPNQIINLVTKATVGLSSVDNTSDVAKPVSTAQQSALDLKVPTTRTINGQALTSNITITAGDLGAVANTTTVNGHPLNANVTVSAGDVGLGNVTNTSDANKPVSTATQTALDLKLNKTAAQRTGTVIAFDAPATYGYTTSETGNFTINTSGLVEGTCQLIIHNNGTAPTFAAGYKIIGGAYVTGVANYIMMFAVKSNLILVTISQEL